MLRIHQRAPLSGGKPSSVVLMLHGWGADGADLVSLADEWAALLPETEFLAPDAPYPCEMSPLGFQWFSLQEPHEAAILAGVQNAAPIVGDTIDEVLRTRSLAPDRLALLGFSQGTMLSLYVAPRRVNKIAGVLGFSGMLVGGKNLGTEKKSSPEMLLVHGTSDPVIPYRMLAEAEKGLREAEIPVSTLTCEGLQHGIDAMGIEKGGAFLKKILGNPSAS